MDDKTREEAHQKIKELLVEIERSHKRRTRFMMISSGLILVGLAFASIGLVSSGRTISTNPQVVDALMVVQNASYGILFLAILMVIIGVLGEDRLGKEAIS